MGCRIYSNITCPNRRCYGKYWRMFSLLRKLFNVKHHPPEKLMYSEYQMIKILENCFQNMNCFSWIKLIPVLIHLKYSYYDSSYLELLCLCKNFTLAYWNPSSTQSWSCSSSVSLFCLTPFNHMTPEVLDIPNNTAS